MSEDVQKTEIFLNGNFNYYNYFNKKYVPMNEYKVTRQWC